MKIYFLKWFPYFGEFLLTKKLYNKKFFLIISFGHFLINFDGLLCIVEFDKNF